MKRVINETEAKRLGLTPPIILEIGKRQNVRSEKYITSEGEMIREVIKTEWRIDYYRQNQNGFWFYWYWKAETDRSCSYDCGFSGQMVRAIETEAKSYV